MILEGAPGCPRAQSKYSHGVKGRDTVFSAMVLVPSGRYVGNVRPLVASQGKPGVLFQKLHPPALLRRQLHFTVNPQGWENSPSEAPYGLQAQPAGGHLRTIVM